MFNYLSHHLLKLNYLSKKIIPSFLICLISSYLICINLKLNVYYHTDGFAPIQQILLLVNFESVGLGDLHLARIPSLFPDLAIIYLVVKVLGQQDIFVIQSIYAFVSSLLYLIGIIIILSMVFRSKYDLIYLSFFVTLSNLFLIRFSSIYREIFGHFLTPVHQGGNIIMTIFFIILILFNELDIQPFARNRKLFSLIITIFSALSIVSNKLFIFTALFPLLITKIFYRFVSINRSIITRNYLLNFSVLVFIGSFLFLFGSGLIGITFSSDFTISWFSSKFFQMIGLVILIIPLTSLFVFDVEQFLNVKRLNTTSIYHFCSLVFSVVLYKFRTQSMVRYISLILFPVFIIICFISFQLNTQCIGTISIDIRSRFLELRSFLFKSQIFILIFITYFLMFFISVYRTFNLNLNSIRQLSNDVNGRILHQSSFVNYSNDSYFSLSINSFYLFISLSGLSPLLYLWAAGGVYTRYMLISTLFLPIVITLLLSNPINYLFRLSNKSYIRYFFKPFTLKSLIIVLVIIIFQNNLFRPNFTFIKWPYNDLFARQSLSNFLDPFLLSKSFRRTALSSKSDFALDHKQINSLGLKYGLSDFWGSSVSEIGTSNMKVSPILPNGKPNYWAHSRYNFWASSLGDISKYNFVYSRDINFTNSIINAYGIPSKIYQLDKETINPMVVDIKAINVDHRYILVYQENSKAWYNIQNIIREKISKEGCQ
tara:strand:- start:906 stop:3041 length:2136 start_codon:yes stop_codon:yes gene_type:complete